MSGRRQNPKWLVAIVVGLFVLCCSVGAVSYLASSVFDGAP
jgi:hypothetical protein